MDALKSRAVHTAGLEENSILAQSSSLSIALTTWALLMSIFTLLATMLYMNFRHHKHPICKPGPDDHCVS
jgi:hypothetical protein